MKMAFQVIASLVPDHVLTAEGHPESRDPVLLPEERALIANAVEGRRREFAQGRDCAHRVLAALGWADFPVLRGANREPLWPPGVVGSITHCEGYVAAAAARRADLGSIRALGIDAEVRAPLGPEVSRLVLTANEQRRLGRASDDTLGTAVFSAKEAVYKCWYPLTGRWLDYQDAEVDLDPASGRFRVRLLPSASGPPAGLVFLGRVAADAAHVFSVATAEAAPERSDHESAR
jgi:4'-phosphopantetheinyl transferase EntD